MTGREGKTMTYHVGLVARGKTAVLQFRDSVDCLSCECLEYYGERTLTKANARKNLKDQGKAILQTLNVQFPHKHFKRVVID